MVQDAILRKAPTLHCLNLEGADLRHVESFLFYLEDFNFLYYLFCTVTTIDVHVGVPVYIILLTEVISLPLSSLCSSFVI